MTVHNWFREYCEKTTSHCMEYFVMKQRSLIEKVFWISAFLLILFLSTTNILSIINVWIKHPTIIVIENEESISDIPFPSIGICSSNQLRKSVWEKYKYTNSSYWEYLHLYQSIICTWTSYISSIKYHEVEYLDYEMIKNIVKDCPISCPELFRTTEVKWQNFSTKHFCDFVQPMLTTTGLCFIINMATANQMFNEKYYERYSYFFPQNITLNRTKIPVWNLDDGYKDHYNNDDFSFKIIPARTSGVSYYHRLILRLHILNNDFQSCPNRNLINGFFLVTYNNPLERLTAKTRTIIMPDTYTKIQITPYVKKVSSDLKSLSPNVRQCYFEHERKLLFYKHYNEVNCINECVINETLSKCGCIRMQWTFLAMKDEKICGTSKFPCMKKVNEDVENLKTQKQCNCLPTCTVINYQVTDTSRYDDWEYLKTTKLVSNSSRGATVEFIFKNPYFTAYRAKSTFNIYSLISVVGGMLGLFLGLSILNVFEVLYVIIKFVIYNIVHIIKRYF